MTKTEDEIIAICKTETTEEEIPSIDFDISKYQVVRGEYFAHTKEPSISFKSNKITLNVACIKRFPNVDYVQILISSEDKRLLVRPSGEDEKDSFVWCSRGARRGSKQISCKVFFAKIINLMGWNLDYRYKLLGKLVRANGELVFAFDMNSTETYPCIKSESEKPKMMRTPIYPQEWQEQFGMSFEEHQKQIKSSYFKGYTVFSVQDKVAEVTEQLEIKEEHNE